MRMWQQPRRLTCFVIDDEPARLDAERLKDFIAVKKIASYRSAQKLLLDSAMTLENRGGDLFLVDVSFERSEVPEGLDWGNAKEIRPFGPLLALPFLGREVCSFITYSSYWGDPSVRDNGFVLVAMSLLLAATRRERYTLGEVGEIINESARAEGAELLRTAGAALNDALREFRDTLGSSKRVQFIDVARTQKRLVDLQESCTEENPLIIPLRDAEGILSIDFAYPPYMIDRIELSSVFADVLKFYEPNCQLALEGIHETLNEWREKSKEIGGATLSEAACKALARAEGSPEDDSSQLAITKAVDMDLSFSDRLSRHSVIRMAIEFAWVQAWYDSLTNHDKDLPESCSMINEVHTALGLDGLGSAAKRYGRLLGLTRGGIDQVCFEDWRTPFKIKYDGTNDAYQLDKDEPSALDPLEKAMCIQYALDLGWEGGDPPYPRWMTE